MKLWAGKLIMPPCMVELVNTKLSFEADSSLGQKSFPNSFSVSLCLGREEAFGVLPVRENRSKIQEAS